MHVQLQVKLYTMPSSLFIQVDSQNTLCQVINTLKEQGFLEAQIHNSRFLIQDFDGNMIGHNKTVLNLRNQGLPYFIKLDIRDSSSILSQSLVSDKSNNFSGQKPQLNKNQAQQNDKSLIKNQKKANNLIQSKYVINAINSIIKTLQFQNVDLMYEQQIICEQLYQCFKELQKAFQVKNQNQQKQSSQMNFMREVINKTASNKPISQIKAFAESQAQSYNPKTKQSIYNLIKRSQIIQSEIRVEQDRQNTDINNQQLNALKKQNIQMCKENLRLQSELIAIMKKCEQLQNKNKKNIQDNEKKIKVDKDKTFEQFQKLKIKYQDANNMLREKNDQLIELQTKNQFLQEKMINEQNEYQIKINDLKNIIENGKSNKQSIQLLQKTINQRQKQNQNLKKQATKLSADLQNAVNRFNQQKKQLQQTNKRIEKLVSQKSTFTIHSNIIKDGRQKQLITLKKFINQTLVSQQVQRYQILYSFDPLNKTNFHNYIDDKQNFLLIAETERGNIVGGFCRDPLSPHKNGNSQSCLFSLTKGKFYPLKKKAVKAEQNTNRAYIYDPYFLVFGNDELMIQAGKKQIEVANLNSPKGFFDIGQPDSKDFLGQGQNKVKAKLIHYQILQVITRPK